jgi:hypothetical protein
MLQNAIDAQIDQLRGQISSLLAQSPGHEVAGVFIDTELALTGFELDSLAQELTAAGSTPAQAELDSTIATQLLSLDELHAQYDLGL